MKKFIVQFILLIILIFGGLYYYSLTVKDGKIRSPFLPKPQTPASLVINDSTLKVLIADEASERSKGLGGRQSLATDEGMLFVYDKPGIHTFWMKDVSFPLDFIWINKDTVIDITENVPPAAVGQSDESLPKYSSSFENDKILEVSAGTVQRLSIKIGDTIVLLP
ncbi:hypothetical protein A3C59_04030 [Candidatus Daviesbacteria bacterium RIFCSPHIGHO2_02_FULL_36_13]|uniref:DUF192 domain-containing protein n=1 Tax=Candidatus Daviesbacteria bacterium RIFCSPHIGHO2_02_FULL_36_13 TaxID=1797768 RepID=A0A1F5JRG6_9BACT|nr:MAG: hypothetical protein A3C59_04030 [Candidatus Daviesbacteria bacterium RIFCSPHIGHO2_02_FULL_36_13]OGE41601.1 MAG: hypothetical protein A3A45_03405 [Candidatus Daviesbacteria bacterium RIFCSPLOWO2_01_FULL_36_8]